MSSSGFLRKEEEQLIQAAIRDAEHLTSGEIRIHIESTCKDDVMDRAAWIFKTLHMHKTAQRNGVLIYLSVKERKLAIIGDGGINQVVPEGFWEDVKISMVTLLSIGQIAEGIIKGIEMAGEKLQHFFPYQKDDKNELSDEISYGK